MCDILREIYKETNQYDFDYASKDDRVILQKTVYLLMNMGIYVGDYSFEWGKYGPYSLALDIDAFKYGSVDSKEGVLFSEIALAKMRKIGEYIKEGQEKYKDYSRRYWLESIASLHYLKYILRVKDSEILTELQIRKDYLSNAVANVRALQIANEIENM